MKLFSQNEFWLAGTEAEKIAEHLSRIKARSLIDL